MISRARMGQLLEPFAPGLTPLLCDHLVVYLELLLKWNARTNLTAVRDPEQIVTRHFGESLFIARQLPPGGSLLDVGSGAGFPGLPIQLWHPHLRVTLAESQGKKAAFLREVARSLHLGCEVWAGRVQDMPADRLFGVVTLRAVDRPQAALTAARARGATGGLLVRVGAAAALGPDALPIPDSQDRAVLLERL